jgi:hypothetical protein
LRIHDECMDWDGGGGGDERSMSVRPDSRRIEAKHDRLRQLISHIFAYWSFELVVSLLLVGLVK